MIFIIPSILKASPKGPSVMQKTLSLVSGGLISLVILPVLLYPVGKWIDTLITFPWSGWVRLGIGGVLVPLGLFFAVWAGISQWRMIGDGGDIFVIAGPYSYCRNPFLLGLIFFYTGLGSVLVSVTAGIAGLILVLVIGTVHFKTVEEKAWENRFGEGYAGYRERTSYLFPRSINWI